MDHFLLSLEIPEEFKKTLELIHKEFPSAIIAGGAIRDLYGERQIKDVDIFIPVNIDKIEGDFDFLYTVYSIFFPPTDSFDIHCDTVIKVVCGEGYGIKLTPADSDEGRDIYCIINVTRNSVSYDLVFCEPKGADVKSFDIGICQAYFDGSCVVATEEFIQGFDTKTIEVLNVNRTDRNERRVQRLKEKYPEFKVKYYGEEIQNEENEEGLRS